ncbi:hypothetical protein T265_14424, partial [Opisthorchis viverrini]
MEHNQTKDVNKINTNLIKPQVMQRLTTEDEYWGRLILCRVSLPDVDGYKDCPWDAIREATVV